MSDDAYGATVAKRRLSRRLAELRGASGYTANHVCDILNWGRGKVGRFEANQGGDRGARGALPGPPVVA
jgi:hypothetical protein